MNMENGIKKKLLKGGKLKAKAQKKEKEKKKKKRKWLTQENE